MTIGTSNGDSLQKGSAFGKKGGGVRFGKKGGALGKKGGAFGKRGCDRTLHTLPSYTPDIEGRGYEICSNLYCLKTQL